MDEIVFENSDIVIKKENSSIPWVKIFTKIHYKELTDCPEELRKKLYKYMEITEKSMLSFYSPEKINIAIFGNYLQHLHIHIMARFKDDEFFPESMWGKKQRESSLNLPSFEEFKNILIKAITTLS
jgi:diadenosine tetraphosphate (Ap4A) HIT family hydrolase